MRPGLRATYRLQLRGGMGFDEARALLPYLDALGVSHVYCSPCMEARSGSTHGYDVVDPGAIDPALGGEAAFDAFVSALHDRGMGLVLDWVPNHVGIARGENPWWQDVLEFGPASSHAGFFDIDWEPARPELRGKVLLPVLGDAYGAVLESGALEPAWDRRTGGIVVRYFEHRFPISPSSGARFLRARLIEASDSALGDSQRAVLGRALEPLLAPVRGPRGAARAAAGGRALAALVASDPALLSAVEGAVAALRGAPEDPDRFASLHALLERQHYRLAFWRVAAEEVNYRRFFDIDELAALRMEQPEVFARTHERVVAWLDDGTVDGLRIDHVDGLADPRGYCERLRRAVARPDFYLVVEKILGTGEPLRDDWPVDGTTGYEFLNELGGLFVDPRGAVPLERLYRRFTGDSRPFDEVVRASKERVMRSLLSGELESLASRLDRIAQGDRFTRDFTRSALRRALAEIVAEFPVYRTYVDARGADDEDRRQIETAVRAARRRPDDPESGLYELLERVLTGDLVAQAAGPRRRDLLRFVTRFQQYTAPVMAKGVEDTSFYRYYRLVSLNEVGGDPRRFGVAPESFHESSRTRAERWPRSMLCTASHDTKRGEDTRARIHVLSELPGRWAEQVRTWARLARPHKRRVAGAPAPAAKDEYLLYQVLVGTWPVREGGEAELTTYRERIQLYMQKALREGKERSSWRYPDAAYEEATAAFVAALLTPGSGFLTALRPFSAEVAACGALYGLSAAVLKLCSPGVPDVYQGTELWDLSLADPDNRRPVDFEARHGALTALQRELGPLGAAPPAEALARLLSEWPDGRTKLYVTWRLLELRRAHPELLGPGAYRPVACRGRHAIRLCAFARVAEAEAAVVLAPRLAAELPRAHVPFPLGPESWDDTEILLPDALRAELREAGWRDIFTGRTLRARGGALRVAECLSAWPVAVLRADPSPAEGESPA